MNNAALVYIRVSTTGQADEGVSLEAQEAKARAWCLVNGYEVASVFCDAGISAKAMGNRPGLTNALQAVCAVRGSALVVYSLSRLARSTKDAIAIAERLDKAGADLVSLTEKIDTTTAAGKMVFRMLAVLAEFERDLVSERTRSAMSHKRTKLELVGSVPYGFSLADDGKQLVANEGERELQVIASAFRVSATACHEAPETRSDWIRSKCPSPPAYGLPALYRLLNRPGQ